MENNNIRNCNSYKGNNNNILKEKKVRNIDLIKSYVLSQPERLKTLNNIYTKLINIFSEFITITQKYSNKLKELAIKINLSENEEKEFTTEVQMFNIIKTILFFNSESLNEIINDIKKEFNSNKNSNINANNTNTNNIDSQKNVNDNLTSIFFFDLNKIITNQIKYEKEMKNYEELLVNQEIEHKDEEKINMEIIDEARIALESQNDYLNSLNDSNNILKRLLNLYFEEKRIIREKFNRKCFFILDTLIFFTKKQNDNYELQKLNLQETYSTDIIKEKEEEELNNHFLYPIPYSLKCLDVFVKKKENKLKRYSEKIVKNKNLSSITNVNNNLKEEKIFKKKLQELKRDNIINIYESIKKNKFKINTNDEKIFKNEKSKQMIKQIVKHMFNNDDNNYTNEEKNKLYKLFDENIVNLKYFFKLLNNNRAKNSIVLNEDTFKFLGEIFEHISKISFNKKDVEIFKLLFILSSTYYYNDNNDKKYIFTYIEKNLEFQKKEFWENYFINLLNFETEKNLNIYLTDENKTSEEIKKEKDDKIKLSLFSNLLMVIQNMIDFHINNNILNEFISKINEKYKLKEEELLQIEIYLNENKKGENDVSSDINNNIDKDKIENDKNNNNNINNKNNDNN